ncbi:MAG: glycosyltransferase family 2 protein [Clostridia bacterium]|nr:glycosyltransferase family 2 protein [Clostridia bacterium]
MEKRIVSVIVPVYNVEKYLVQCIESIRNQVYSSLEIMLVDDGSPDNCGVICDEYAQKDSRIRVIHKKNGGLSDARNAGIDACTGAYITCVDSDDLINPKYISRMMELMTVDVDMVVCTPLLFSDNRELAHADAVTVKLPDTFCKGEALRELLRQDGYNFEPSAWGKLYRRKLFGDDLRFPVGKFYEDLALTYRLVDRARKIVRIKEPLYYYRQRPTSQLNQQFDERMLSILEIADEMQEYLAREHPELKKSIHSRVISAYCHILIRLPENHKWDMMKRRIYLKVKELRQGLLFYNCRAANKIAVLCSYGGEKLFISLMKWLRICNK